MLSVHSGNEALPPKGVFDWHYLQCVAKRFATDEYKEVPGVYFSVLPFKTDNDDLDQELEFAADETWTFFSFFFLWFYIFRWFWRYFSTLFIDSLRVLHATSRNHLLHPQEDI